MRLGIRAQLIGYTLATALLVGGVTIGYSIYKQRTAIHQELQTRAKTMASAVAKGLVDPFYEGDVHRLSIQLEMILRDPDVVAAIARDEVGTEIAFGGEQKDRSASEPKLELHQLRASNWEAVFPGLQQDTFTAVSPVRVAGGDPIGFVCLTFTKAPALERIRSATWEQMGLLLGLFALGTVMAVALSRRFVNPIHAMVAGTKAIREGGFKVRIPYQGRDELGVLAESINSMAENLQRTTVSKDRLEQANTEVLARSKELEAQRQQLTTVNRYLEDAKVDALLATRAKSDFLANMSHEIRTPMTAILGFSENLRDGELSKSEESYAIETIHRNGEYLLHLINDILDMSKIEAGKMEVEHVPCSPHAIVADVLSLMQVRAVTKSLALHTEFVGSIPETIQSDPTRLKQILINIIGNGIKFTEEGGVRLITRFVPDAGHDGAGSPGGPLLQFDVLDTGVGMTGAQVGRLFQAFAQSDNTMTRKFGGTGLGLTISKRFAEMLGGDVTVVDSQPGRGTRFRVTIATGSLDGVRMIDEPNVVPNTAPPRPSRASQTGDPLDCRVLLAEDGPDNQRLISFVLKKAGARSADRRSGTWIGGRARPTQDDALQARIAARSRALPSRPRSPWITSFDLPDVWSLSYRDGRSRPSPKRRVTQSGGPGGPARFEVLMPERIGAYTILRELGRGGMGVVHLAHDAKLDRDVAIKVLPAELAEDAERVLRFEREAKLLALLNHTNIAQIYGLEESDNEKFLVLEYVDGETLAARIRRGALPVDEALEVCRQIAEALEAAHDKSVIHRDLKPGNVMVKADGTVKVLDFGLARAMQDDSGSEPAAADSPTITANFTRPGVVLGTAPYMSPEQARGRPLDKRTDIWSFGVVLYELLTGISPFAGETATDSIGAVLHKDVDLDRLPSETPALVRHVLRMCLVRDKRQRLQAIGDARVDLELALAEPGLDSARTGSTGKLPWIIATAGAAFGLAVLGLLLSGALSPPAPSKSVLHLALPIGQMRQVEEGVTFAFSPVSRTVAYIAQDPADDSPDPATAIYLRDLDSDEVRRLAGTEHARYLSFSPDGTQLAFTWYDPDSSREEVRRVSVSGGPVLQVFADRTGVKYIMRVSLAWISNDEMLAMSADRFTLYRLPIAGGDLVEITTFAKDGEWMFNTPSMLGPDSVFLSRVSLSSGRTGTYLFRLDLETGEVTEILTDAASARLLPGGRMLFVRNKTLCVAQFDADSARVIGAVTPIVSGLLSSASYSVSAQGDLLVARSVVGHESSRLMSIDRAGQSVPLIESRRDFSAPVVLSDDGRQLAITIIRPSEPSHAHTLDLDTGFLRPAFPSAYVSWSEGWAPDGRLIANQWFNFTHGELFLLDPSSSADATPILPETDGRGSQIQPTMTPDGRFVVFRYRTYIEPDTQDIYAVDLESDQGPVPIAVVVTSASETSPSLSPDGAWLAYSTDASGTRQIVLQAFDPDRLGEPTRVYPASFDGGRMPFWSAEGNELFFLDTDLENLFGVEITTDPVMSITPPKLILGAADLNLGGFDDWPGWHPIDITPDGERFVYIERAGDDEPPTHLDLTINWLEELDKLVPPRR